MESTPTGKDFTREGNSRASRVKTRLQSKLQMERDAEAEIAKQGMTADKWWTTYVRSQQDVVRYYQLYQPEYPEILVKAIALRLDGIIEKTRTG